MKGDGMKVELLRILDENKDEVRSPAPVVYGIVNRKLFCSPKFFPKILWASSGPEERDNIREGQGEEEKEDLALSLAPLLS